MGTDNPRLITVMLAKPLVFVPYTSAVTTSSADAKFDLLIPTVDVKDAHGNPVKTVPKEAGELLNGRFIYVFLAKESAADVAKLVTDQVGEYFAPFCMQVLTSGNPKSGSTHSLLYVVRPLSASKGERISGSRVLVAAERNEFPEPHVDGAESSPEMGGAESSPKMDNSGPVSQPLRFFAVGSPAPLSAKAIIEMQENPPKPLPAFDPFALDFPYFDSDGHAKWAFPVLDPLAILDGLTRKQYAACDEYLAYTQSPETRKKSTPTSTPEVTAGRINLLLKGVADSTHGLRKVAGVDGELNVTKLEKFFWDFDETVKRLRQQREDATFNLIKWLSGDWMTAFERLYRRDDGTFEQPTHSGKLITPYKFYLDSTTKALARLAETDTGAAYLSRTAETAKTNGNKPGVLRTINQFVLRDDSPGPDVVGLGRELALGVFGAWSGYFEVMSAQIAAGTKSAITVEKTHQTISTLAESVHVMWSRVQYVFDGEIVEVQTKVPLRVPIKVKQELVTITVNEVRLAILDEAEGKLSKTNLKVDSLQAIFGFLNLGLTYCSFQEALRKGNIDEAKTWSSAFDLAESVVFFGDQMQKVPALAGLRLSLYGSIPEGATAISRRLGLLGSVMALGGSTMDAIDNYNSGDFDAAAAEAAQGIGALMTGAGYVTLMTTPASGPLGGFFLVGGTLLSVGGLVWCVFAKDTPYEQLAKFSAFGNDPAGAARADGWALCPSGSFKDWNPNTEAGLKLQLKAAEQLFYSFRAAATDGTGGGKLAADVHINLFLSSVRPNSVLHISYDAVWGRIGEVGKVAKTATGDCEITWSRGDKHAPLPEFSNSTGHFIETDALKLVKDGDANVVELRFRLKEPIQEPPLEISAFTCRMRLDVHGDGTDAKRGADGSLVVPNSAKGVRQLQLVAFDRDKRSKQGLVFSHRDDHVN